MIEAPTYRIVVDGLIEQRRFPSDLLTNLRTLRPGPDRYFAMANDTVELPVDKLLLSRLRHSGALQANKKMQLASEGKIDKRPPVTVRLFSSNLYIVIDGNSTTANAIFSRWHTVPCVLGS